jgi:hypothetical protein
MDILNSIDDTQNALGGILSPENMESRIEALENVIEVLIETSQGLLLPDKSEYLRLIAEVWTVIKDCRTIAKLLNERINGNE